MQCGTEKGKKPFLHTRAVMNADHLCPSWSAGNGLALEPHHIYRSKHGTDYKSIVCVSRSVMSES